MVRRHSRLDQNASSLGPAARASCDLAQKLKASLGGTKIRKVYSNVCIHHSDERDVRKIEPFRNHLRAKEDIDFAGSNAIQYFRVRPLSARSIDIHARDSRRWKPIAYEPLDLLRSETTMLERLPAAAAASCAKNLLMRAVMAKEPLGRAMQRQGDAAVGARDDVTAIVALNER
jgi:hypothetical protein